MENVVTQPEWQLDLGANLDSKGNTTFRVWAPHHLSLSVKVLDKQVIPMQRDANGFFTTSTRSVEAGDRYYYVMENGLSRPDPVSRVLPECVHGSTEVFDPNAFTWHDEEWEGRELRKCILYEMHVGTFTEEGTFDAAIAKLHYIKKLGVSCIELMPLAQFPGRWNWGYDGASLYTPYSGYGGAEGFKRFVDACHKEGIAVCLDVVYNHLGPEGNYLGEFGPYFSDTYHTPWGRAFNYDGAYSEPVREYVVKNALYWITEYHVDMLRLDAIHGIYDISATPMLPELIDAVQNLPRKVHIIAESGQNDTRVLRSKSAGGWEMCAIWNDDFHHAAHVALTEEQGSYYRDFNGLNHLSEALSKGFVYDGKYSEFRKRRHGNRSRDVPFEKFIIFMQNHDQIGNRPLGERLSTLLSEERRKIAACFTLMTPFVPMLFMGEEYGERAPFEYFVDYENEKLMRSIFEGRKREFHRQDMPFPGKESFDNSRMTWKKDTALLALYQNLIALRMEHLPKQGITGEDIFVYHDEVLAWEYPTEAGGWIGVLVNLGEERTMEFPFQKVQGELLLATSSSKLGCIPSESCLIVC